MAVDPAGLIIGNPGLFQTCVHGYRFVCEIIDLNKNVVVLRLRYRIEESPLALWGRFWGLLVRLTTDILNKILDVLQGIQKMSQKHEGGQARIVPPPSAVSGSGQVPNPPKMKKHSTAISRRARRTSSPSIS
jgi:hypothetical protein